MLGTAGHAHVDAVRVAHVERCDFAAEQPVDPVEPSEAHQRTGRFILALRQGAAVSALGGREVEVTGMFWFLEPPRQKGVKAPPRPVVDLEVLRRALSTRLGTLVSVEPEEWHKGARARIVTDNPASVLAAMAAIADEMGTQLNPWVADVDAMGHLLRRLMADVST